MNQAKALPRKRFNYERVGNIKLDKNQKGKKNGAVPWFYVTPKDRNKYRSDGGLTATYLERMGKMLGIIK